MVHAENGDVIDYLIGQALSEGNTDPIYHARTRPSVLEGEATGRAAKLTALADCQLYVVHVTCSEAVQQIAESRNQGLEVWGETCPQYLLLDETYLERPNFEGAKVCMVTASSRSLAPECIVECTEEWTASDGRLGSMLIQF